VRAPFVLGQGDLDRHLQRLVERQRALRQPLRQRLARQVLHHQVVDAILGSHIVHVANVRMLQRRQRLRLALEPLRQSRG
jgi:hypothetical protein